MSSPFDDEGDDDSVGEVMAHDSTSELTLADILPPSALPKSFQPDPRSTSENDPRQKRVEVIPAESERSVGVGEEELIRFPAEVESAISAVFPSQDPLDQPDFSTVDYINRLFPSEQSLNNLDDVIAEMK